MADWNVLEQETGIRVLFRVADSNVNMTDILKAAGYSPTHARNYIKRNRITFTPEPNGKWLKRWVDMETAFRVCNAVCLDLVDPLQRLSDKKLEFGTETEQVKVTKQATGKLAGPKAKQSRENISRLEDGCLVSLGRAQPISVGIKPLAVRPMEEYLDRPAVSDRCKVIARLHT